MKSLKNYRFSLSAIFMLALGLFVFACKGPEGPAGSNGKDGKDGADGSAVCGACHNNGSELTARAAEYALSVHGEGEAFMDANRSGCAACHVSEGFAETCVTGADTTVAAAFDNPSTINCRTCHNIHTKYDKTDWGFRTTPAYTLRTGGHQTSVDLGKMNLCGRCHQSRVVSPDISTAKNDTLSITSLRWGPHYGGQSNIQTGNGLVDLDGGTLPSSTGHASMPNSCIRCHMAKPLGLEVGGHTFNVAFVNPTTFSKSTITTGCISGAGENCHSSVDAAFNPDKGTKVKDMTANILKIRVALATKGWLDTTQANYAQVGDLKSDYVKATTAKPLKLTTAEAKILLNYLTIVKDQSWGVHNPKYVYAAVQQLMSKLGL